MQSHLKLSIGLSEDAANPDEYTKIEFNFQFHKDKVSEFIESCRKKTGRYRIPTIIFDFPLSAQDIELGIFKSHDDVEYFKVEKEDRVYKCLDLTEKDYTTKQKKIEKVFGKLTELDNKAYLHLNLYNVDSYHSKFQLKDQYPISVILEKAKIEANLNLDPQFYKMTEQLIHKISPKFAQSPFMAFFPMLNSLELDIQMDSLSQLEQSNQMELFGFSNYEEPRDDEEGKRRVSNFSNKDKVNIYVTYGMLGFLKVQLEVRMFEYYRCIEPAMN